MCCLDIGYCVRAGMFASFCVRSSVCEFWHILRWFFLQRAEENQGRTSASWRAEILPTLSWACTATGRCRTVRRPWRGRGGLLRGRRGRIWRFARGRQDSRGLPSSKTVSFLLVFDVRFFGGLCLHACCICMHLVSTTDHFFCWSGADLLQKFLRNLKSARRFCESNQRHLLLASAPNLLSSPPRSEGLHYPPQ